MTTDHRLRHRQIVLDRTGLDWRVSVRLPGLAAPLELVPSMSHKLGKLMAKPCSAKPQRVLPDRGWVANGRLGFKAINGRDDRIGGLLAEEQPRFAINDRFR